MKYTTFKGKRGKWGVMSPDGKVIDVFISEQSATHHAQKLNEGIAPLHAEIATLKAALNAQSETIAMYKQFAHIVLAYAEDGNLYHLQVIARGVLGDSGAANATAESESVE